METRFGDEGGSKPPIEQRLRLLNIRANERGIQLTTVALLDPADAKALGLPANSEMLFEGFTVTYLQSP